MIVQPQVYEEKVRKARKPHKCCECLGIIEKGENYVVCKGIWDGECESFKICVDCSALRKEVTDIYKKTNVWDDGIAFRELAAEIDELGEPFYKLKFNNICKKRKSDLRLKE